MAGILNSGIWKSRLTMEPGLLDDRLSEFRVQSSDKVRPVVSTQLMSMSVVTGHVKRERERVAEGGRAG